MAEKKSVGHAYNIDFLNVVFAAASIGSVTVRPGGNFGANQSRSRPTACDHASSVTASVSAGKWT